MKRDRSGKPSLFLKKIKRKMKRTYKSVHYHKTLWNYDKCNGKFMEKMDRQENIFPMILWKDWDLQIIILNLGRNDMQCIECSFAISESGLRISVII